VRGRIAGPVSVPGPGARSDVSGQAITFLAASFTASASAATIARHRRPVLRRTAHRGCPRKAHVGHPLTAPATPARSSSDWWTDLEYSYEATEPVSGRWCHSWRRALYLLTRGERGALDGQGPTARGVDPEAIAA
jgi:hypothetical protein